MWLDTFARWEKKAIQEVELVLDPFSVWFVDCSRKGGWLTKRFDFTHSNLS